MRKLQAIEPHAVEGDRNPCGCYPWCLLSKQSAQATLYLQDRVFKWHVSVLAHLQAHSLHTIASSFWTWALNLLQTLAPHIHLSDSCKHLLWRAQETTCNQKQCITRTCASSALLSFALRLLHDELTSSKAAFTYFQLTSAPALLLPSWMIGSSMEARKDAAAFGSACSCRTAYSTAIFSLTERSSHARELETSSPATTRLSSARKKDCTRQKSSDKLILYTMCNDASTRAQHLPPCTKSDSKYGPGTGADMRGIIRSCLLNSISFLLCISKYIPSAAAYCSAAFGTTIWPTLTGHCAAETSS